MRAGRRANRGAGRRRRVLDEIRATTRVLLGLLVAGGLGLLLLAILGSVFTVVLPLAF